VGAIVCIHVSLLTSLKLIVEETKESSQFLYTYSLVRLTCIPMGLRNVVISGGGQQRTGGNQQRKELWQVGCRMN
jgi:hypothetical protein